MSSTNEPRPQPITRRDFVRTSAAGTVGAALLTGFPAILRGETGAARSLPIRIAAIGCGGRGTGAITDALNAAENVELVAMADLFPDRLEKSLTTLREKRPGLDIPANRRFTGWDA